MSVAQRGKQAHWPAAGSSGLSVRAGRLPNRDAARVEQDAARRWLDQRDGSHFAAWFRRLGRALWHRCSYLNAPVLYRWSASRVGNGLAHVLHQTNAALTRKYYGQGAQRLWLWTKACLWPMMAIAAMGPLLWRCGRRVRDQQGISLRAQARDLAHCAWRHGIFPAEYYHHRVFRMPAEIDRSLYLSQRELQALLRECARRGDSSRVNELSRFLPECRAAGLPVPRVWAVAIEGKVQTMGDLADDTLPQRDLFLRPSTWERDSLGQQWRWNARSRVWRFRDETRDAKSLIQLASRLSHGETWVLQESVSDHPDIARLSAGGVCTVQVVTGLVEARTPQILFAALHLPAAADAGWGPAPGELVAGIDVATGRLGPALDEFVSDGEFSLHPATGAVIEDAMLPQWHALIDLASRAHEHFVEFPFIAWRLALSGSGPMILEARTDWGVLRHVWPARTAFGPACHRWLSLGPPPVDESGRGPAVTASVSSVEPAQFPRR